MGTARYYREDKQPGDMSFPGVPLADISDEEWETYPKWLQDSIDASDLYQKSNPSPTPRKTAAAVTDDKET